MRLRALVAALAGAAAAVGCGGPAALLLPSPSPPGEALAWFPEDSIAIALFETDLDDPGVSRALRALTEVAPGLVRRAPEPAQLRPLLGNSLAVGITAPGESPLGVLVTRDGGTLSAMAGARVNAGLATPAGTYRGARLHAAEDHAFAVRHDVLLVSRSTADLREALDRRATEEGMDADDLPRGAGEARASLVARPWLIRADPRLLAVPWLAAAERLDAVVRAGPDAATADLTLGTAGEDLVRADVPLGGGTGARVAELRGARVAVRDAPGLLRALERAAFRAAPLTLLRARPALPAARRLVAVLAGPATLVHRGEGFMLRADPSRPRHLDAAVERLARALPATGLKVRRRRGSYEVEGIRFGVRSGTLVAGTAPLRRLERLARARLARPAGARGSLAFDVPEHDATGWASATPSRTTARLRIGWP